MGNHGRQWDSVTLLGLTKSFQNGNPPLSGDLEYRQVPKPIAVNVEQEWGKIMFSFCSFIVKSRPALFLYGPVAATPDWD
jgi:hypothetical protein